LPPDLRFESLIVKFASLAPLVAFDYRFEVLPESLQVALVCSKGFNTGFRG
jgi:hypothetical protein